MNRRSTADGYPVSTQQEGGGWANPDQLSSMKGAPTADMLAIVENTMLSAERLEKLGECARAAAKLPGDFAELGVYKGGSALFLSQFVPRDQRLLLFDTFKGLPKVSAHDTHVEGEFACDLKHVEDLLHGILCVDIYPGVFPKETKYALINRRFSLVHIDCDLYEGVRAGLELFGRRMIPGGFIVLDDPNCPACPGALKAMKEYLDDGIYEAEPGAESQVIIPF